MKKLSAELGMMKILQVAKPSQVETPFAKPGIKLSTIKYLSDYRTL